MKRIKGMVKWWSLDRGHGFILGDDGKEYFVHYSAVKMNGRKNLEWAQDVEFEPLETEKGPRAAEVVPMRQVRGQLRNMAQGNWKEAV